MGYTYYHLATYFSLMCFKDTLYTLKCTTDNTHIVAFLYVMCVKVCYRGAVLVQRDGTDKHLHLCIAHRQRFAFKVTVAFALCHSRTTIQQVYAVNVP